MELFELPRGELEPVLAQIRAGHVVASRSGQGHALLLRTAADSLGEDAIFVRVAHDLDAGPYVALSIAAQCGPEVSRRAAHLLADRDVPAAALQEALLPAMAGRPLLVEGLERLRGGGPEWDSAGLLTPAFDALREWLAGREAISSRPDARAFGLRRANGSR